MEANNGTAPFYSVLQTDASLFGLLAYKIAFGAPCRIRTHNLESRNLLLYSS